MGIIFDSITYDIILVLFVLWAWLYFIITSKHSYWEDRGLPYVKPTSVLNDIFNIVCGKQKLLHTHIYDKLHGNKCGGFFEMNMPVLIIMDPDLIERVLVKDFTYFHDRGFPTNPEKDPLNQNLSTIEGEKWRHLRYKMTPTFTTGKLKGMFEQICNCGEILIKDIEKESKIAKSFNSRQIIANFSLDVIASCAFGIKLDTDQKKRDKFREMVSVLVRPTAKQLLYFMLFVALPKIAKFTGIKSTPQELEDFIMKLVSDTLKYRKENKIIRNDFLQLMYNLQKQEESEDNGGGLHEEIEENEDDEVINQMKHTGISNNPLLGKKQKVVTDACIAAQSFVFLFAGLESVSSTLGYVLYCLGKNFDVQEKLHNEIDSVLENCQHKWSYKAIKEMTYLDQVIQETLRLYPIAPELQRICTEPYKLPGSNLLLLDKGIRVVVPVMSIHNDPNHYENPEVFDPERFINNNFKPSGIYMPFGNGPRICIAMRFAILELKVCVARILYEYRVTVSSKTQEPLQLENKSFLLSPVGGFWFEFNKRN